VLVVHIASAGAWIGMDVVLGVLVATAALGDDVATSAVAYQALKLFAVWPLLATGLLCLASGVVLGLGTKYGLLRYWWVLVKLVMNVVLTAAVYVSLRPGLAEASAYGEALVDGVSGVPAPSQLAFPPIVSTTCLLVATVLSVVKPWGRMRG
jgi:hypothetical protein